MVPLRSQLVVSPPRGRGGQFLPEPLLVISLLIRTSLSLQKIQFYIFYQNLD